MSAEELQSIESLESWLHTKPYWERRLWLLCSQGETLSEEQLGECFESLCRDCGIAPKSPQPPEISFCDLLGLPTNLGPPPPRVRIAEVASFKGVNALSDKCALPCGPNLTVVFGRNGSGKSGVSRLLANACFSRGNREILPDLRSGGPTKDPARATFRMLDAEGKALPAIDYVLGSAHPQLKRFAVYDDASVHIHVDATSKVNIVPSSIVIFDRVATALAALERRVSQEKSSRRKENPFGSLFDALPEVSDVSGFCASVSARTREDQLLEHCSFTEADERRMADLNLGIESNMRLNITARKVQLANESAALEQLRVTIQHFVEELSLPRATAANELIDAITEQRRVVEQIGLKSFENPIIAATGTSEWKALLKAARVVYELEAKARSGLNPDHCVLCRQRLEQQTGELFSRYWDFLENESEAALTRLESSRVALVESLKATKARFPQITDGEVGVQAVADRYPDEVTYLREQVTALAAALDEWIREIASAQHVSAGGVPKVSLSKIAALLEEKKAEIDGLTDPAPETARLRKELITLQHRQMCASVKSKAMEYLAFLKWRAKVESVNFATIKGATTKRRTETFLVGVATEYKRIFNAELEGLGCEFNLVMNVSGDQGRTVKQFQLEYSEDHQPSQVLSEGERNVCALADFLTETQLSPENCGIFLDDPVSSLDHERKGAIAFRLAKEAASRQVVILTHDIAFIRKLVDAAAQQSVPCVTHWIQKRNGTPGIVTPNSSPKLASVLALKKDAASALEGYEHMQPKDQEHAVALALDYLRSGCEALIEEYLFAKTMQRHDDHVRVQNLAEAILNEPLAARIMELHGEISASLLAHNISDEMGEGGLDKTWFCSAMTRFEELEVDLKAAQRNARKERKARDEAQKLERTW